jgi:hypothetical protein
MAHDCHPFLDVRVFSRSFWVARIDPATSISGKDVRPISGESSLDPIVKGRTLPQDAPARKNMASCYAFDKKKSLSPKTAAA